MCILPREKVIPVRCQPKTHPCPTCGKRGRRVRRLDRRVRSLAYQQEVWLHVFFAEYRAPCSCRKYFRSWPLDVPQKADYCPAVRHAVLDRILGDRLNVERARAAMKRDFLLDLSSGFVYDCLDWAVGQLNQAKQRRQVLAGFRGTLCVDELHLGEHTLLLATDPLADQVVGFALVKINDAAHLRRFLLTLSYGGFQPEVVVSDGSNLYPAVLASVWPAARHQLCVFHVLQDVTNKVLQAVRRLRREQARRGKAGRKRRRGGQGKGRARRRGPSNKEKAAFVFKHRYLIVKRYENLSKEEWEHLSTMFQYLPELRTLWDFCGEAYELFSTAQVLRLARRRRTLLLKNAAYRQVPELAQAMNLLSADKFAKRVAFLSRPAGQRVRTNNHVERANRAIRADEKARYNWRSGHSLERFLLLRLSRCCGASRRARATAAAADDALSGQPTPPDGGDLSSGD